MEMNMSTSTSHFTNTQDGDRAFAQLVSGQVRRVTQELQKLEQLLKAGMVDLGTLKEFRTAIDEVRKTSWTIQKSLEEKAE